METIKIYLENMFSSLPDTMEVRQIKEELFQMMEDKYVQLKSEGKSENEAVGIVITEFGNLEEIKEELGIREQQRSINEIPEQGEEQRYVSRTQVNEYMDITKKYSKFFGLATMLCVFSPALLIFLSGLSEISVIPENTAGFIGIITLFIFIIAAVPIFIYCNSQMEEFEFLKKEAIRLDRSTEDFVCGERKRNKSSYSIQMIIGVMLCIFSVVPLLFSGFLLNDFACIISTSILLIIVGVGVFFIVPASMLLDVYKILLQEGEYNKRLKNGKLDTIATVYWCVVTAIYLAWSFWTFQWGYTWIVWPVAGVLYGAIAAIVKGTGKK